MKITITREFTTASEAMEFLARVQGPSPAPAQPEPLAQPHVAVEQGQPPTAKKARKGRSDAGQPRGPYKTTGAAAPETAGASQPTTPGTTASTAASAPAAASTTPAAPAKSSAVEPPQAASAPAAAELTEADVRATLGLLNSAPGGGVGACLKAIKDFGYERVSAMPKEKYAEFDVYIRSLLPKGT
jgi:hypothetical protein